MRLYIENYYKSLKISINFENYEFKVETKTEYRPSKPSKARLAVWAKQAFI